MVHRMLSMLGRLRSRSRGARSLRDALGVGDIRNAAARLADGDVLVYFALEGGSTLSLMAEDEQDGRVAAAVAALNVVDFPVQFYQQSRPVDFDDEAAEAEELAEAMESRYPALSRLAMSYAAGLRERTGLVPGTGLLVSRAFLVLRCPRQGNEAALDDLVAHRVRLLESGFGASLRRLNTEDVVELLHLGLNPKCGVLSTPIRHAKRLGLTAPWVTGLGRGLKGGGAGGEG